jgi:hypothetical protein
MLGVQNSSASVSMRREKATASGAENRGFEAEDAGTLPAPNWGSGLLGSRVIDGYMAYIQSRRSSVRYRILYRLSPIASLVETCLSGVVL